mmetsp:Transcript_90761/g.180483  ORF Transcript_90761/g.180483 Transcript_90761/m.180483 type:complete len:207 (-) Transcript_90761:417-1037(-)
MLSAVPVKSHLGVVDGARRRCPRHARSVPFDKRVFAMGWITSVKETTFADIHHGVAQQASVQHPTNRDHAAAQAPTTPKHSLSAFCETSATTQLDECLVWPSSSAKWTSDLLTDKHLVFSPHLHALCVYRPTAASLAKSQRSHRIAVSSRALLHGCTLRQQFVITDRTGVVSMHRKPVTSVLLRWFAYTLSGLPLLKQSCPSFCTF